MEGEFLRGPIPLAWLSRACRLGGPKVLPVSLAIWFEAGRRKRKDGLKLTRCILERFGVTDRSTKSRALTALEEAGLVRVHRQARRNPQVDILDAEPDSPA